MIVVNQQIAIHLKQIRNLSGYTSGRFVMRISIYQTVNAKRFYATPVNIIQRNQSKADSRSQFDETYFITKTFPIKSAVGVYFSLPQVELNEICIFKYNRDLSTLFPYDPEKSIKISCEMIQVDQNREKIVGVYTGRVIGSCVNQYLEIDFYEGLPCQIIGSVHACSYKFQFLENQSGTTITNYCEKYCKYKEDEMLQFLKEQGGRIYKQMAQIYCQISKKQVQIQCPQLKRKQSVDLAYRQKQNVDVAQKQTQLTQGDEDLPVNQQQNIIVVKQIQQQAKKRRKKIFSMSKQSRFEKYQEYEILLHEQAQKIYSIWRDLLGILFQKQGQHFIDHRAQIYKKDLKQKMGESIARFKGDWDSDKYHNEEDLRAKMADQLRNPQKNQILFKQLSYQDEKLKVYNQSFFSNLRPIFFEERATNNLSKENNIQKIEQSDILVILVHGLGACRLDMQKIKIQLRRYYDTKIKIYTSSTNEGRTEGDIDSMGMRLAAQLDYQLNKYGSKIPKICLLGHSMGGIIIRSALPRLQKYKSHFHSLITLSSPHLGYAYSTSKLVDAGLWLLNTMKKCTSILQLTMQDAQQLEQTFLYKLSQKNGLQWFKKVVFLASHQDLYVPFYSARIQKHQDCLIDCKKKVKKGIVYCQMIDQILSRVSGTILRLNVNFCIPQQNIDNLIGRAAHISFITNVEMVRTFALGGEHYFF